MDRPQLLVRTFTFTDGLNLLLAREISERQYPAMAGSGLVESSMFLALDLWQNLPLHRIYLLEIPNPGEP
jgi:hypothetical protein